MSSADGDENWRVAAAIAAQISAEQQLTAARMNWNLTFQGFMIAGFALVATSDYSEPRQVLLEAVIALAGMAVTIATWLGVLAAQRQSSFLKAEWNVHVPVDCKHPRPFSQGNNSLLGRAPTWIICGVLAGMWIILLLLLASG